MEHLALNTALATALAAGASVATGALGFYCYAAQSPASQLFGRTAIAPRQPNQIALTFDDGPNPRWTPMLLDILARHNVRATFFLIGKYAVLQKPLVREMQAAGHRIGNHSWSHPNFAWTGNRQTREELTRTQQELESILGQPVRFFRPPYGARRPYTLGLARSLGLTPVLWNAMAADWNAASGDPATQRKDAAAIAERLTALIDRNQRRGFASNIVLHDGGHRTLEANRAASIAAARLLLDRFTPTRQFVTLEAWERQA